MEEIFKTARYLCSLIAKAPHPCDAINALAEQLIDLVETKGTACLQFELGAMRQPFKPSVAAESPTVMAPERACLPSEIVPPLTPTERMPELASVASEATPTAPVCDSCGGRIAWRKGALVCVGSCKRSQGASKQHEVHQYMQTVGDLADSDVEQVRRLLGLGSRESLLDAACLIKLDADRFNALLRLGGVGDDGPGLSLGNALKSHVVFRYWVSKATAIELIDVARSKIGKTPSAAHCDHPILLQGELKKVLMQALTALDDARIDVSNSLQRAVEPTGSSLVDRNNADLTAKLYRHDAAASRLRSLLATRIYADLEQHALRLESAA